jgi:serine/threonine protein kinase
MTVATGMEPSLEHWPTPVPGTIPLPDSPLSARWRELLTLLGRGLAGGRGRPPPRVMVSLPLTVISKGPFFPGAILGDYRLLRQIGVGGMGVVWEGLHRLLRRSVAIKMLLPELSANREARARFVREAEIACRIEHPHIVKVTDFGQTAETAFYVMEFLEGETLAGRLEREGRVSAEDALDMLLPIMDGLAAGHGRGVVHRDVKPENIFLARQIGGPTLPKILDFGVSKLSDGTESIGLTMTGALLGTAKYIAPEQIESGKNVDGRADQYAMGLILAECLTGTPLRTGNSPWAILEQASRRAEPSIHEFEASPALRAALLRSLAWDRAARYPGMVEFMKAVLPSARAGTRWFWVELLAQRALDGNAVPSASSKP